MQLINTSTQQVVSLAQFKSLYPNTSFPRDPANIPFEDYGFAVVQDTTPPEVTELQKVVEGSPVYDEATEQWQQTWGVVDRYATLGEAKSALKRMAKRISQELERGGYTLAPGARIDTTDQGQGRIGDAESWLKDQPEGTTLNWNDENDTWHTVDLAAIQHIKQVAGAFVQACFDARYAHHQSIDALADMDACHDYAATQLNTGWPVAGEG